MSTFIAGFALGFSLILAIGAQNAFVLRQGLIREHVALVVATCAISDAILIVAGVSGMGAVVQAAPKLEFTIRLLGAAFLLCYGARAFWTAWKGGQAMTAGGAATRWQAALATCLALTWLNPHVYLDTVVLLGSISAQFDNRGLFGFGAATASFVFFTSLGFGARLLTPVFSNPTAWRALDIVIGLTMWAIAISLLV